MEKLVCSFALNLGACVVFHREKPPSCLAKVGTAMPSHASALTTGKPLEPVCLCLALTLSNIASGFLQVLQLTLSMLLFPLGDGLFL